MVAQPKEGLAVPHGLPCVFSPETLKYWVGVQQGKSLVMVGHSFSDGVTIKMLYGVDVSYQPAS